MHTLEKLSSFCSRPSSDHPCPGRNVLADLAIAWKKKAGWARKRDQKEREQIWRSLNKEAERAGRRRKFDGAKGQLELLNFSSPCARLEMEILEVPTPLSNQLEPPTLGLPSLELPSLGLPSEELPSMGLPSLEPPSLGLPSRQGHLLCPHRGRPSLEAMLDQLQRPDIKSSVTPPRRPCLTNSRGLTWRSSVTPPSPRPSTAPSSVRLPCFILPCRDPIWPSPLPPSRSCCYWPH